MLSPTEVEVRADRLWYLPHFAATHPNKPGKIRLVFDAAAKSHGTSLNDNLFTGPDLLNSLVGVLYKFRQRRIAFTGDIQEMFHQIPIIKEDLVSQRFLWRGRDRTRQPDEMEMSVMTFGSACSPFSAQSVKNKNADCFKNQYPQASSDIRNLHYMDDYLKSTDDEKSAIQLVQEVSRIHEEGGFKIRSWTSNSQEVLDCVPEDLRAEKGKTVNDQGFAVEKVLGLRWLPDSDNFTFTVNLNRAKPEILDGRSTPTKREVLRLVMSVFDPLGFVAHLTIKAQILLQKVWKSGIGWDDELPQVLGEKWLDWVSELKRLPEVQVPRCYSLLIPTADSIQLHILCDASEQAFSAVAYFKIQSGEEVQLGFIGAKSKVAPVRQMSIPRLELQAAVLGSRLARCVQEEHEISISSTHLWSDSTTVLHWLRAEGRTFKTFVAHRIGEIDELTELSNWHWIPTKLNIADDATRDNILTDLSPDGRWFKGPDFLKLPEVDWPKENIKMTPSAESEEEMKKEFSFTIVQNEPLVNVDRFSKYSRLVRTMGWVRRFPSNIRGPKSIGPLSVEELCEAEVDILKESQIASFPEEIKSLGCGKSIHGSSRLAQLSPFIDEAGIIRLDGRLKNADVSHDVKFPVILSNKNKITKLIIQYYHEQANHHGQEQTLNEIRQKFWILNSRAAVRSVWNSCQSCKNHRVKPVVPEMGILPEVRVRGYVRSFTHTGVDYFGPLEVTVGRRREKRYGVLFTCLTTRAVHLEVAGSLTTDSCVMAITRMIARRGCPSTLYSDNGTNFRGAEKEIRNSVKDLNQDVMMTKMTTLGIKWHFNPPAAPHMGGAWERLVRSVKTALYAILKEQAPKEEVLHTFLLEAESIVNSRPLTHVSIDPRDPESLTPFHFLIGTSSASPPLGQFSDEDLCMRKKWRIAQQLANQFWKRWVREYLPSLIRREKWHQKITPVKIGDVVLICDLNHPRNVWPRGIIVRTFPGKDGQVRVADVKTTLGIYRRPVSKICVLDVLENSDGLESNTVGEYVDEE